MENRNLSKYWWHRLAIVLFILFMIVVALYAGALGYTSVTVYGDSTPASYVDSTDQLVNYIPAEYDLSSGLVEDSVIYDAYLAFSELNPYNQGCIQGRRFIRASSFEIEDAYKPLNPFLGISRDQQVSLRESLKQKLDCQPWELIAYETSYTLQRDQFIHAIGYAGLGVFIIGTPVALIYYFGLVYIILGPKNKTKSKGE